MGLCTQSQIRKLRHEVIDIREDQERIVEAVTENKASINYLEKWYKELNGTVEIFKSLNPGVVITKMRSMHDHIQHALEVAVHTVQQAQQGLQLIVYPLINCSICLKISNLWQAFMASNFSLPSPPIFFKLKRHTFMMAQTSF